MKVRPTLLIPGGLAALAGLAAAVASLAGFWPGLYRARPRWSSSRTDTTLATCWPWSRSASA
jgi:hypothetical protein